jgi:ribosomal protein L11 methyltransferase
MSGTWIEVKVITSSEAIEPVCGIFYSLDVKGVAIEDPNDILQREQGPLSWDFADINILEYGDKAAVVKGYFNEEDDIESIVKYIEGKIDELKSMDINAGECTVTAREVHEEDWANNWKQYYKPTRIGENIVIKPEWEDYNASPEDIIIEMDPGMAFGTGTHETTRMCILALQKYVKPESTVFDIGTGSGILAITAARLGAKNVVGVDLDPVAVDSAKQNIALNKVENIDILYGNLMEVVQGKANIVVANIIAEVIMFLAEDVKQFLLEGGYFITSGIIKDKKDEVCHRLKTVGFDIVEAYSEGEWVCIIAKERNNA